MNTKYSILQGVLIAIALSLAFAAGFVTRDYLAPEQSPFPILSQAREILLSNAYEPAPEGEVLEYGMIRGMVTAYGDPFTVFNEPAVHELQNDALEGSYGGIGVRVERDADQNVRLYPFEESPASERGIAPGDILINVDGTNITEEISIDEVIALLRGREGVAVQLEILRPETGETLQFSIARAVVPLPSVTWRILPDAPQVGVIEVNIVAASTPEEIMTAYEQMVADGASYFILDLRDNRGGLLQAGVDTARLFLRDGLVIAQQFRGKDVEYFLVEDVGALSDVPLVVLVNGNTASAAEIIAGSLQGQGRATIIGTSTFGKDVIQLLFELSGGSSIQVSAAKWWIPNHSFPNDGRGILPDVEIPAGANAVAYFDRAVETLLGTGK